MDEMIGYIFGKIRVTDNALNNVGRIMKRQNKINRNLAIGVMLSGVGLILTLAIIQEQNEKIEQLYAEVIKMKEPTESAEGDTESEN